MRKHAGRRIFFNTEKLISYGACFRLQIKSVVVSVIMQDVLPVSRVIFMQNDKKNSANFL